MNYKKQMMQRSDKQKSPLSILLRSLFFSFILVVVIIINTVSDNKALVIPVNQKYSMVIAFLLSIATLFLYLYIVAGCRTGTDFKEYFQISGIFQKNGANYYSIFASIIFVVCLIVYNSLLLNVDRYYSLVMCSNKIQIEEVNSRYFILFNCEKKHIKKEIAEKKVSLLHKRTSLDVFYKEGILSDYLVIPSYHEK